MAGLSVAHVPSPERGLNLHAAPRAMPVKQSPVVTNLLPGLPGKAKMRGPIKFRTDVFGTAGTADAIWTFEDWMMIWRGNDVRGVQLSAEPTADFIVTTPSRLGPFVSDQAYQIFAPLEGFGYGATSSTVAGSVEKHLMRWTVSTVPSLVTFTNAPKDFTDLLGFQRRLLVLGGKGADGTNPASRAVLYWSDIGGMPSSDLASYWQDDVSGLLNRTYLTSDDMPIALAHCGQSVAIVMQNSIWMMSGNGPSSWSVRCVFEDIGCLNKESIVETASGFYFMSDRGYAFTDGVTYRIVSDSINSTLLSEAGNTTVKVRAAPMTGSYLVLTLSNGSRTYLLETGTESWSTFTSKFLLSGVPQVARTVSYPIFTDGRYIWRANLVTRPEWATTNAGRDDQNGTIFETIEPIWESNLIELGGPTNASQLNRVIIEYVFAPASTAPGAVPTSGWFVKVQDRDGTVLLTEFQVPAQTADALPLRQRYVADVFSEASTVKIHMEWRSATAPTALPYVEIHDVYLEYQTANRQVR